MPYTPDERAAALELVADHGIAEAARRTGISTSTLSRWAKADGIEPGGQDSPAAQKTAAARVAAAERHAVDRSELEDVLLRRITRVGAALIAGRLERALEAEQLVDDAVARWHDCMRTERQAADFGPDAVKDARQATAQASDDVAAAQRLAIGIRDLVGVTTRALNDYLALTGVDAEGRDTGELIVELLIPEPEPADTVHAEHDLERTDTA